MAYTVSYGVLYKSTLDSNGDVTGRSPYFLKGLASLTYLDDGTTVQSKITSLNTTLTTATGNISSLTTRMSTAEGNISTANTNIANNKPRVYATTAAYNSAKNSIPGDTLAVVVND